MSQKSTSRSLDYCTGIRTTYGSWQVNAHKSVLVDVTGLGYTLDYDFLCDTLTARIAILLRSWKDIGRWIVESAIELNLPSRWILSIHVHATRGTVHPQRVARLFPPLPVYIGRLGSLVIRTMVVAPDVPATFVVSPHVLVIRGIHVACEPLAIVLSSLPSAFNKLQRHCLTLLDFEGNDFGAVLASTGGLRINFEHLFVELCDGVNAGDSSTDFNRGQCVARG